MKVVFKIKAVSLDGMGELLDEIKNLHPNAEIYIEMEMTSFL